MQVSATTSVCLGSVESALMRVLGIESSCDETAAALVTETGEVLADVIASQIAMHGPYGGIVPELASRAHMQAIIPVIRRGARQGTGWARRHRRDCGHARAWAGGLALGGRAGGQGAWLGASASLWSA